MKTAHAASLAEMGVLIEEHFEASNIHMANVMTVEFIHNFTGSFFTIIVLLLLIMGVLIATVGALELAGTMSTNVLERTREIGVMRAIGASDFTVLAMVMVEGVIIGLLSWVVGAALAYPAGFVLSSVLGLVLFQAPLSYVCLLCERGLYVAVDRCNSGWRCQSVARSQCQSGDGTGGIGV